MPTNTITTYDDTLRMDLHEVVRQLVTHLGATVVATLSGVRDRKMPYKWAQADGPMPRDDAASRLQVAHRIWEALASAEKDHVARAWFIGVNPRLDETQPMMALREGRLKDTLAAAQAFLDGTEE